MRPKNYLNLTLAVKIIVKGWAVYFFATHCTVIAFLLPSTALDLAVICDLSDISLDN